MLMLRSQSKCRYAKPTPKACVLCLSCLSKSGSCVKNPRFYLSVQNANLINHSQRAVLVIQSTSSSRTGPRDWARVGQCIQFLCEQTQGEGTTVKFRSLYCASKLEPVTGQATHAFPVRVGTGAAAAAAAAADDDACCHTGVSIFSRTRGGSWMELARRNR